VSVEIAGGFFRARGLRGMFCFRLAMPEPVPGSLLFLQLPRGSFACLSQIDNLAHFPDRSCRLSTNPPADAPQSPFRCIRAVDCAINVALKRRKVIHATE